MRLMSQTGWGTGNRLADGLERCLSYNRHSIQLRAVYESIPEKRLSANLRSKLLFPTPAVQNTDCQTVIQQGE